METWKDIPLYEGLYQASDQGRIKSLKREIRLVDGRKRTIREKILKQCVDPKGYHAVKLYKDNDTGKRYKVHRLIVITFLGMNGYQCRHIDDNKSNNKLSNLLWGTQSENQRDRIRNGRQLTHLIFGREKLANHHIYLIKELVKETDATQRQIADLFKVSEATISTILNKNKG